jgi:hypothetical protein
MLQAALLLQRPLYRAGDVNGGATHRDDCVYSAVLDGNLQGPQIDVHPAADFLAAAHTFCPQVADDLMDAASKPPQGKPELQLDLRPLFAGELHLRRSNMNVHVGRIRRHP